MHFFTHNTNGQSLWSPDMQEFPAEMGMVLVDECLIRPVYGVSTAGIFLHAPPEHHESGG
jgi:hypothetical protein